MTRNLKILGLTAAAACLTAAAMASAAQATVTFTSPEYPSTTTSHTTASDNVFTINKGSFKCKTHHHHSVTNDSTTTITTFIEYKECTLFGLSMTMNMNGCHYVWHIDNVGAPFTGNEDIICPEGKKIVVKSLSCTIEIGGQTGLNELGFENIEESGDIKATMNISGISYTTSGSCGASSESNGTFKGTAIIEGFNEAEEPQEVMVG